MKDSFDNILITSKRSNSIDTDDGKKFAKFFLLISLKNIIQEIVAIHQKDPLLFRGLKM